MSSTTETVPQLLLTYSENIGSGPATHHLTLYRAASGALVFDAGHRPVVVGAQLEPRR